MRWLLLSNFISTNPKNRNWSVIATDATVVIVIVMMFGNVVGFMNLSNAADSAPLWLYSTIILQNLATFVYMRCHREEITRYMTKLQEPTLENLETDRLFRGIMKKVLTTFYVCYVTILCGIFISFSTNRDYENDIKYVAPFWFSCAKENTSSFGISRICWRTDTALEYFILNVVCFSLNFLLHIPYIMSIAFFLLMMQFKKAHRRSILRNLKGVRALVASNKATENTIYKEFENVVRQYQWLRT